MRRGNGSVNRPTKNQTEEVNFFKKSNSAVRTELENVNNFVNNNKFPLDNLQMKSFFTEEIIQDFSYAGARAKKYDRGVEVEVDITENSHP